MAIPEKTIDEINASSAMSELRRVVVAFGQLRPDTSDAVKKLFISRIRQLLEIYETSLGLEDSVVATAGKVPAEST